MKNAILLSLVLYGSVLSMTNPSGGETSAPAGKTNATAGEETSLQPKDKSPEELKLMYLYNRFKKNANIPFNNYHQWQELFKMPKWKLLEICHKKGLENLFQGHTPEHLLNTVAEPKEGEILNYEYNEDKNEKMADAVKEQKKIKVDALYCIIYISGHKNSGGGFYVLNGGYVAQHQRGFKGLRLYPTVDP